MEETEEERNAHSVLCLNYKDLHILFTGDMGISEETELLDLAEENGSIQQEYFGTCTDLENGSPRFHDLPVLPFTMPLKAAFISYGKDNSYGHPSGQVTEEMKKQNISFMKPAERGHGH